MEHPLTIIHLRAKGTRPGTTKDWIAHIYEDRYVIHWGRTGSTFQKREVYSSDPSGEAHRRAGLKVTNGGYTRIYEVPPETVPPEKVSPKTSSLSPALKKWTQKAPSPDWST